MTTYRNIHGRSIQSLATDPTESVAEGQVWYNTTSDTFKSVVSTSAWSSAASLSTARYLANGFGSQTAGVYAAGQTPPGTNVANTEEYNGTGWTTATSFPSTATSGGSGGTATAGVVMGGGAPYRSTSFKYDGSSWTATGALPTAADNISACGTGTQTNIIAAIGRTPSSGNSGTNTSVTYNGSTFSSGPNLNTARMYGGAAGTGTGTAGLVFGGFIDPSPNAMTNTEEYDGSSWTNAGALNVASSFPSGFGTQTLSVAQVKTPNYGGSEQYNGSTWSSLPNTGLTSPGGLYGNSAGTTGNAGWIFGYPAGTGVEFNTSANVITGAVFSSGGTANTARRQLGYTTSGTQNSCMGYGGFSPSGFINNSETYDGTSWSEGNNLNDSKGQLAGAGTATAALAFGGNSNNANTEEYNGTSWSEQNNMNAGRYELGGCGLQTAGLACGGDTSPPGTSTMVNTEEYDGTNWTTGGNLNTARRENDAAGSQTAAIVAGGGTPSGTTATESYNGTAWTTVNSKIRATVAPRTMGGLTSQTAAVTNGGHDGSAGIVGTEQWNGTNFSTGVNMAQQRFSQASDGSISAGIVFMGDSPTPAMLKTSEEYNGETTVINVKTLTQS